MGTIMFHMYSIVDNINLSIILFLRVFAYFCVLLRFTFSIILSGSGPYLVYVDWPKAIQLNLVSSVNHHHLLPGFVYASRKGSDETVRMRRLA